MIHLFKVCGLLFDLVFIVGICLPLDDLVGLGSGVFVLGFCWVGFAVFGFCCLCFG